MTEYFLWLRPSLPSTVSNAYVQLRFINSAGFATFVVGVDGHNMTVVALDAVRVKTSKSVRLISLAPGQRVAVLLCPATPEVWGGVCIKY